MNIAVVGGRGVIGDPITARLKHDGHNVTVVTHSRRLAVQNGFKFGDLLDGDTLDGAVRGAEVVIQSANFGSYPFEKRRRGHTFMAFDGRGAERLVSAAERGGARRFVFIAGVGCRDGEDKPYWIALRRGESAVLRSSMEGICIEPTLVFGTQDRSLNRVLAVARRTHVVPLLGRGDQMHQPVFVQDLAEVVSQAVHAGAPTGAFAVGGPERLTMKALIRRALTISGLSARLVPVPVGLARFGSGFLERLPGEVLTRDGIDFALEDFVADLEPVIADFELSLTPLDVGLRSYLAPSAKSSRSL